MSQYLFNIDWATCFCLEHVASFDEVVTRFENLGYQVELRQSPTRVYLQVWDFICGNRGFEVSRVPASSDSVLPAGACHVRFKNMSFYTIDVFNYMRQVLAGLDVTFVRFTRIDVCVDVLEKFPSGDSVAKFIHRYIKGRYSRFRSQNVRLFGREVASSVKFNGVFWGSRTSFVNTRLYCKSQELIEARDKPYIRSWWRKNGLCDMVEPSVYTATDELPPPVWRLEFELHLGQGSIRVTDSKDSKFVLDGSLASWRSYGQLGFAVAALVFHYFKFYHVDMQAKNGKGMEKLLFPGMVAGINSVSINPLVEYSGNGVGCFGADQEKLARGVRLIKEYFTKHSISLPASFGVCVRELEAKLRRTGLAQDTVKRMILKLGGYDCSLIDDIF